MNAINSCGGDQKLHRHT